MSPAHVNQASASLWTRPQPVQPRAVSRLDQAQPLYSRPVRQLHAVFAAARARRPGQHAALCGPATPMPPGLGCTPLCMFHFLQIYQTAWTTPVLTCRRPASPPSAAPAASPSGSSVPGPLSSGVGGSAAQLKAVVCLCPTAVGLFSMMFSRWPCSPAAWLGAACPGGCCRAGCLAAGRRRPPQHMPPPELSNAMPAMIPCLACRSSAAPPPPLTLRPAAAPPAVLLNPLAVEAPAGATLAQGLDDLPTAAAATQ